MNTTDAPDRFTALPEDETLAATVVALEEHGFRVQRMANLNKISTPAWWLYGRVLHRSRISKVMLKVFDKTVWIWRRVDGLLPWRGLSLVAVATKEKTV